LTAPASLAGKRITVMGLGRFGGGSGVARWLVGQGASVLVTDLKPADKLAEPIEEVRDLLATGRFALRLGEHREDDFTTTDLIIANPAVPAPWDNRFLAAARAARVPITTEIGLLVERLPARERTIGITGTVGKSTTTAMIAHALSAAGETVHLGGNIGGSLLDRLPDIRPQHRVVLELSSFMLHWLGETQRWSPHIAVATNIAENHLDWHGNMDHYIASKQNLLRFQTSSDIAVLGSSLPHWAPATPARTILAGEPPFPHPLAVPGRHNRINAAVAAAVVSAARPDLPPTAIHAALASFPGLPHRLALCARPAGRLCYNDSKATTPEATLQAITALAEAASNRTDHLHLIVGGYDKHADLSALAHLAPRLAGLYCIGDTGPAIAAAARAQSPAAHVVNVRTLPEAVAAIWPRTQPGHAIVLSPGCASWDHYPNYEHRGDDFVRCVRDLAPESAS